MGLIFPSVTILPSSDRAIANGRRTTPGWVFNLRATPEATVAHGSQSVAVTARSATEDEIEVFVLEPQQS